MRFAGFLAAIVLAAFGIESAAAEGELGKPPLSGTPTVTILNKSPDAPKGSALPELAVTPGRPAAAAAPSVPASPVRADAPGRPTSPVDARPPAVPARPVDAAGAAPPATPRETAIPTVVVKPEEPSATQGADAAIPAPELEPTLVIDIDLSTQRMTVSEHGEQRYTWAISSARYGYRTPTGTFRPTWMSKMWYSRQYEYAPMPFAIFFHQGVAIHATYSLGMLGRPASHGCVRVAPKNAQLLYRLVSSHTKARTEIVVHGTPIQTSPRMVEYSDGPVPLGRSNRYRYMPPAYDDRAYAPPPTYYYSKRSGRFYAMPRRQPRGLYGGYSYEYGF